MMNNTKKVVRIVILLTMGLLSSGVYAQTPKTPLLISDIHWSPDGSRIALGIGQWQGQILQSCDDTRILLVDSATGQLIPVPRPDRVCSPSAADFSKDGSSILLTLPSGMEIWNLSTQQMVTNAYAEAFFQAASYSPDGSKILVTLLPGAEFRDLSLRHITLWSPRPSGDTRASFVYSAWSPDGTKVASSMNNGYIYVWSAETAQLLATFEEHHAPVKRLTWNPESNRIASGDDGGIIWIWDTSTGQPIRQLSGHSGIVYDLDWSPDGQELASVGEDNTLRVWNPASGAMRIVASSQLVSAVAYSPDGSKLAYAGAYSTPTSEINIVPAPHVEPDTTIPPTAMPISTAAMRES